MKNIIASLIVSMALFACSSGGSSGSGSTTPATPAQASTFISQTSQSLTPSNLNTDFSVVGTTSATSQKLSSIANISTTGGSASCVAILPQPGGAAYTVASSGNQWWSTVSLTFSIVNNCGVAESFVAQAILNNFQINGGTVVPTSASVNQSGSPYMTTSVTGGTNPIVNITTPSCSGSWCSWATLANGASMTFTVQTSVSAAVTSVTLSGITLDVKLGGDTPTPGSLSLSVNTSPIVQACGSSCNNLSVSLINSAGQSLYTQAIVPTVGGYNFNVQNLAPGGYSFVVNNVPSVSGGTIGYTFTPSATVTVGSGATAYESLVFSYSAVNAVNVNLANVSGNLFESATILARITNNSTNSVVQTFKAVLGGTASVSSSALVTGESYTLQIQGLADPKSGTYYGVITAPFTVSGTTTTLNESYTQISIGSLVSNTFTVVNPVSGQTLSFASDFSYFVYNSDSAVSGTYYFPTSDTLNVTISSASGYTTTTNPSPAVITNGTINGGNTLTITNTAVSTNNLMVGYLANSYGIGSAVYTTVSQAAQAGYNVVVAAFAMLQGTTPMSFYNNQFLAYTGYETFSACPSALPALINDIANAKKYYGLKYALVSVGGGNSTFAMQSGDNVSVMAQNIVNFVTSSGFDGIDFDVEQIVDPQQFASLIAGIKALAPNMIISAAPQSNSSNGNNTAQLVTTGTSNNYNQALQANGFNFIWLQGYNTGGYTLSGTIGGISTGLCDETMPCFIPAAYSYYTSSAAGGSQIPISTVFIVGEPASKVSGGDATVWNNTSYPSTASVYQALRSNYQLVVGQAQYGGAMTWSINQDIDAGCSFASAVAPVVTGNSSIVCPTNGTSYHTNICY